MGLRRRAWSTTQVKFGYTSAGSEHSHRKRGGGSCKYPSRLRQGNLVGLLSLGEFCPRTRPVLADEEGGAVTGTVLVATAPSGPTGRLGQDTETHWKHRRPGRARSQIVGCHRARVAWNEWLRGMCRTASYSLSSHPDHRTTFTSGIPSVAAVVVKERSRRRNFLQETCRQVQPSRRNCRSRQQ